LSFCIFAQRTVGQDKPIPIEGAPGQIRFDIVTCGKPLHAGVLCGSLAGNPAFELFDVIKGARVAKLTVPRVGDTYVDMNRDGSRAAFWSPMQDSDGKVSIWSLNDGKSVIKDWEPYPAKVKEKGGLALPILGWVYLLDEDKVLTFGGGGLDFWSMPDMKHLHRIESKVEDHGAGINYFAHRPTNFAITHDRNVFVRDAGPWGYEFFDSKTFKAVGMTASMRDHGAYANRWNLAIRPDGKEMAASFQLRTRKETSTRWARWSIPSGKLISLSAEPIKDKDFKLTGPICYWGEKHLLIFDGNRFGFSVMDLEKNTIVRTAKLAVTGRFATSIADDRLFFVTTGRDSTLGRVILPRSDLAGEPKEWKIQVDGTVN
jgi:hypothetical protein